MLGPRPGSLPAKAQNILVIGSDTRAGQPRRYGAALAQVPGTGSVLTLVLGSDYGSSAHVGRAVPAAQPSPSFSSWTASQSICT